MAEFFQINLSEFSIFSFLWLIFRGVLLFGFLWVFKNYLFLLVIKSPVRRKKIIDKLPPIYSVIWILFALYVFYFLIKPFPFLGVLISLLVIYLSRGYLINLFHGLFFRLKGRLNLGQKIAFDSYQGSVLSLNNFDFEIQNKEGEIVQIPYGNMANKEIVKQDVSADFSSFKFSIKSNLDTTEQEIRAKLVQSPWVTNVLPFSISQKSTASENLVFDVVVYLIDEKYQSFIERDFNS